LKYDNILIEYKQSGSEIRAASIHSRVDGQMGTLSELSRPEIYAMGNICSIIAKEKKKATPPLNLSELLSTLKLDDDISATSLQNEIDNNVWINRFVGYLRNLKRRELETALKFLIVTQPLQIQHIKRGTFGSSAAEKRRLFKLICDMFLNDDQEEVDILALDNSALFNDLLATYSAVNAGLQVSDESLDEILKARRDLLVWDEGLEPAYFKFVQQTEITHVACLLSLL